MYDPSEHIIHTMENVGGGGIFLERHRDGVLMIPPWTFRDVLVKRLVIFFFIFIFQLRA